MLSALLNLLRPSRKSDRGTHRPLKMQMVYGQPTRPLSDKERLSRQKMDLLRLPMYQNARIEQYTLNQEGYLIGLNKHRLIHNGVFMYPETVQESTSWADLIHLARQENTGIGAFKLKKSCECLRISTESGGFDESYLITKDYLTRVEWVLRPEEISELFT